MTPSELKYQVEIHGEEPHFFDRKSMKFFGDSMRNYGVRKATITTNLREPHTEVWELYRKRPVLHGLSSSAYFRADTFARCFKERD